MSNLKVRLEDLLAANHRNHPHHVKSRGAGGDDVATNVISLCGAHHQEIHQVGTNEMRRRYSGVENWMSAAERAETAKGEV